MGVVMGTALVQMSDGKIIVFPVAFFLERERESVFIYAVILVCNEIEIYCLCLSALSL